MVTQVPTNRQTRRHRGTAHSHLLAIAVTAACCFALHRHETCCTNNRNQRLNAAPLQTAGSSSETVTGPTTAGSPRHAQGSTSKTAPDPPHCSYAQAPQPAHSRRVLVTGAAGFIGYHTCKALATQPDTFVLGLDNFDTHYNSSLKLLRKQRLHQVGINVVTGDIRNETSLQELFACYRFTQVVHLAARAGVRQSGTEAGDYVSSNVVGTAVLLEVMRRQNQPLPSLVYASSSSVYGIPRQCSSSSSGGGGSSDGMGGAMDTCCCQLPVQLHGNMQHLCMPAGQQQQLGARHRVNSSSSNSRRAPGIDTAHFLAGLGMQPSQECRAPCSTPASVYAATKVATEKLVAVYVHQYNLRATGLRFFTVYGPLGRPDMAVMSFTKKLLAGEPVDILCFPVQPMLKPAGVAGQASAQQTAPQQAQQLQEQTQQQQRPQTQKNKRRSIQDPQLEGDEAGLIALHGRRTEIMQVRARSHPQGQPAAAYSVPTPPDDCIPTFRDFTAVSDVVHGILAACNRTAASLAVGDSSSVPNVTDGGPAKGRHRIYNIGLGQPHSTLALLQRLQQLLGVYDSRVRFVRAAAGTPDVWATWADTTAAQRELGFRAAVRLSEGLQEFGDWYVSDAAAVQHL